MNGSMDHGGRDPGGGGGFGRGRGGFAPRDPNTPGEMGMGGFGNRPSHRATASLIFGSLAILAGILLLLDRYGIVDTSYVFRLWPVILVAVGINLLLRGRHRSVVPGTLLTVFGLVFLLRNLGFAYLSFRDLWPVVLIVVGAAVLANSLRARRMPDPRAVSQDADFLGDWAIFGGVNKFVQSQNFRGGDLFAMFGGIVLNLRKAKLSSAGPVLLNATAIMGGIELHVPDDWHVVNEGMGLLGGYSDSRRFIESPESVVNHSQVLIIRGMAIFGGVEIKN